MRNSGQVFEVTRGTELASVESLSSRWLFRASDYLFGDLGSMDPVIHKSKQDRKEANLEDYASISREFHWQQARNLLTGLPGNRGLNIAFEAVDRHIGPTAPFGSLDKKTALLWRGKRGTCRTITYEELARTSNQFANVIGMLGLSPGAAIFGLLPRVPELYTTILGTLKARCVFSPLFAAFGPEPIKSRMEIGDGELLVTSSSLYKRKVLPIRDQLTSLKYVLLIDDELSDEELFPDTLNFNKIVGNASTAYEIAPTSAQDAALLHFTSGTTGTPKGAIHVHEAVVAHNATGRFALDLHCDDIFWCTADPGWVTGMSYGVIAPLVNGVTMIVDEGDFEAERWYSILQEHKVTVWYTAPTAIRMLMKSGADLAKKYDLSALRLIASVGEPLNPEAIRWGLEAFGKPIHDNWWQTETGGIMISNFRSMDIKPGSMGKPVPGVIAYIAERSSDGKVTLIDKANQQGELALRTPWPSMFRGYLKNSERYEKCFSEGLYFTGDLAKRDEDGYFWFIGRADDVIKSAGHLIGPFEVESALMEHPAVAEAAVIGKPDPLLMEIVKAFVALKSGYSPSEELLKELLGFSRKRLGPAVAPREIVIVPSLPKTRSGKIMRRLLKARELGLPEGDISTLETT
jgi:acetyl-CoA synthetase